MSASPHLRDVSNSVPEASRASYDSDRRALDVVISGGSWALRATKRSIDVLAAALFFLIFGWLYIAIWLGVLITSGGPGMFTQQRLGRGGRVFKIYKFRSMVRNSQEVLELHLKENPEARRQWRDFQKLSSDPRITKFGAFIRKTSLDELPQFWNVLIGDMSLIGPRPCMLDQKELYGLHWSSYCAVRPGITGLWQVSGRNKLSYYERVELDACYVKNMSVIGDLKIFIRTLWVVASGHGSH